MKVCWLHESTSLEKALMELGHSKSSLKKSSLKRSLLNKVIKNKSILEIPESLFNRDMIYPVFNGVTAPHVIDERGGIMAISKPSRVHCHPLHYLEGDNLLSYLREKSFFEYLKVNQENRDRGLLYRLDYETSGLCLITKEEGIYRDFRENHHKAQKIYLAVVRGEYKGDSLLHHKITTSGKTIKLSPEGKEVTLKILESNFYREGNLTLLKVQLFGGARHQIRVQLSSSGYPLIGDTLYGGEDHQAFGLHCYRYDWKEQSFVDESNFLDQFLAS